jgi:NADH:ubiquinone oxidoreductase subunit C
MEGAELFGFAAQRWVEPADLVTAASELKQAGYFFESMTCVDRLAAGGHFELLYTFNRYEAPARHALRVKAPQGAELPSLTGVYPIAEWNEREAWEFYGLRFADHPNLTWLLLPEGTAFHPLLKSFTAPPPSEYDDSMQAPAEAASGAE